MRCFFYFLMYYREGPKHLKYPIGQFECPNNISEAYIESWISILEHFPNRLERFVKDIPHEQLDLFLAFGKILNKINLN